MPGLACRTVEFHRFAGRRILDPTNRYIRTAGWDTQAKEVSPTLEHADVDAHLQALRSRAATDDEIQTAIRVLGEEADRFLPAVDGGTALLHVDLVTSAAELWAFPFEACFAAHAGWLAGPTQGVVLTRRVRGDFSETTLPWPERPRVLFAHAPVAADLAPELIAEHVTALEAALSPWSGGKPVLDTGLLEVCEIASVEALAARVAMFQPAQVHLLAHGALLPSDAVRRQTVWGLRLGAPNRPGSPPLEIAAALNHAGGLPVLVTLAACDSANQADVPYAPTSVAQELHRCGVPVVVGSQLPLTKPGSTVLTRELYRSLFRGDDVRVALHAARTALKANVSAGHDWMSVAAYVRLPHEGYATYLKRMGLLIELRLLEASQTEANDLALHGGDADRFARVESLLRERIARLVERRADHTDSQSLEESHGLEASAYKRLAELLSARGRWHADDVERGREAALGALQSALSAYRTAFEAEPGRHWLGVQCLALEAALTGAIARPRDWDAVMGVAQIARDRTGSAPDYWSCGTLAELALIAPLAGRRRNLTSAKLALSQLVERAPAEGRAFAAESTRRQFARYVHWWTTANGFFPGRNDLAADAGTLVKHLATLARRLGSRASVPADLSAGPPAAPSSGQASPAP